MLCDYYVNLFKAREETELEEAVEVVIDEL